MSPFSPLAAAILGVAIFFIDTLTPSEIAIAVLYVAVVLLSVNFANRRGVLLVAAACMGLSVLSFLISHGGELLHGSVMANVAVARCLVSLVAIGITTFLALKARDAMSVLAESERRYRNIFLTTGVAILELDFSALKIAIDAARANYRDMRTVMTLHPDFARTALGLMRLINANEATLKLFGVSSLEELMTTPHNFVPREAECSLTALVMAIWDKKSHFESEGEIEDLQGRRLNILYTVKMPHDRPDLVLISIMDVTDLRAAEDGLHEARAELAHVSRVATLGELTASIAHEVNQPLAAIVTNGEAGLRWLDRESPDLDEGRASLHRMIAEGKRASEVIKRLRNLSSKSAPQTVSLDVNEIVDETITLVWREIVGRRVSLRVELASNLPPVLGDRVQLQQVIINLVLNAIQAMSATGIEQKDLLIQSRSADGGVVLSVKDTGPGFSLDALGSLFNAFYSTKAGGMGMGLSICRSIVEAHGGRIDASLNPAGGATFEFFLPMASEIAR